MKIRYSKVQRYKYEIAKSWSQKTWGGGGYEHRRPLNTILPRAPMAIFLCTALLLCQTNLKPSFKENAIPKSAKDATKFGIQLF